MTGLSDLRLRRREQLRAADVYLVTEDALSGTRTSEEIAVAALAAGIRIVQVREKEGTARRALEIALALRAVTRGTGQSPLQTITLLNYPGTLAPSAVAARPSLTPRAGRRWRPARSARTGPSGT